MPDHVVIGIPCLMRGGTEQQTLALSRALRDVGARVSLLCYFEHDPAMLPAFRDLGVETIILDWPRDTGALRFVMRLRRALHALAPDTVHIQYMKPGLLAVIAARLASPHRLLATVHQPGTPYGRIPHLFIRLAALLTDCFVCVSEAVQRSWFGSAKLVDAAAPTTFRQVTIPNAIDVPRLAELTADANVETIRRNHGAPGPEKVIAAVGRLSREKGFDVLLRALPAVLERQPDARLWLIGEGHENDALHALAQTLEIPAHVIQWCGSLPWPEAMQLISVADVVAVPSRFEGFGLTAAEALACGTPVVASDVDALPDIVQHGVSGQRVPPDDPTALAAALSQVLADPSRARQMGAAGRRDVEQRFSYAVYRSRCRIVHGIAATADAVNG